MGARTEVGMAICLLLLAGAVAGQPGQRGVSNREVASGVPQEFKALYEGGIPTGRVAEVWAGFPYDRIDLEADRLPRDVSNLSSEPLQGRPC